MESFPIADVHPRLLKKLINDAYSTFTDPKVLPVEHLSGNQYLMNESAGPTASFKDLALQIMPKLFQNAIKDESSKYTVFVATSGDTGSAVLSGFEDSKIPVFILFPKNGVR